MRAAGHHWIPLILVVVTASTIGCRGSRPFGSGVQVSQKSDSEFPEIEAPAQRLATAKPRTDVAASSLGTEVCLATSIGYTWDIKDLFQMSQISKGSWSVPSKNSFWPNWDVILLLVIKNTFSPSL